MIKEIYEFNKKVIGIDEPKTRLLNTSEREWLITALNEEIEELKTAWENESLIDSIDAILDLTYFAIGGLVRQGLKPSQIEACFNAIHHANMSKAKGVKQGRENFDGVGDAIKPEGWMSPEEKMKTIIEAD